MDYSVQPVSLNDLRSRNLSSKNLNASDFSSTSYPAVRSASSVDPKDPNNRVQAAKASQQVHDTVQISSSTRIEALKQTGNSAEQIAAKMGLSVVEVEQVLDVPATTSSSSSTVTVSPALAALTAKH